NESISRSDGNSHANELATSSVIIPPAAIDHGRPKARAATPLSNAPSSLEAPMKTPSTAVTRPSCSCGVASGTSEPRMNIDTMSAAEMTTSAMKATAYEVVSPNTIVPNPKIATTTSNVGP